MTNREAAAKKLERQKEDTLALGYSNSVGFRKEQESVKREYTEDIKGKDLNLDKLKQSEDPASALRDFQTRSHKLCAHMPCVHFDFIKFQYPQQLLLLKFHY